MKINLILFPQIILFAITAYQDFKNRAISWFIPLLIAFIGFYSTINKSINWHEYLASLSFICLQLFLTYLYFAFKNKTLRLKFTNDFLGWGDILFFVAMIPYFEFIEYIVLLVLGLIFSLVGHLILYKKLKKKSIPLAGWLSIYYILYFIITI